MVPDTSHIKPAKPLGVALAGHVRDYEKGFSKAREAMAKVRRPRL